METKFKVGQRVKDIEWNKEGVVKEIRYDGSQWDVWVDYPNSEYGSYTIDGKRWHDTDPVLFPIDPPLTLTEWQMNKFISMFEDLYNLGVQNNLLVHTPFLKKIESILSQPEPEKYQPKQGESVLVRSGKHDTWGAAVASGDPMYAFIGEGLIKWDEIRPFSPDLVGKVTE